MIAFAQVFLFLFGALSIAGGVMGFVKAKSRASLVAGGIAGILLAVAGWLVGTGSVRAGLLLGLALSVALAGRFVPGFLKSRKVMPAGLMAALAVLGIVITALALLAG